MKNKDFNLSKYVAMTPLGIEYVNIKNIQEFLYQEQEFIRLLAFHKINLYEFFKRRNKLLGERFKNGRTEK